MMSKCTLLYCCYGKLEAGHATPEAETGGELRGLLLIAFGQLMMTADTYPTNGQLVDAALKQFAAHTRRAVLLGKLEELESSKEMTEMDRLENGYAVPYKYISKRIKALKAELKEIES